MSRGVQRLWIYLSKRGETQAAFSERSSISRNFLNQVLNERKTPGKVAMARIEIATRGAVKAAHWFQPKRALRRKKV